MGSRRLNRVVLVPLANVFVKFGTAAQVVRLELNSGMKSQVEFVPVDFMTTLEDVRESDRIVFRGGGGGGRMLIWPKKP